MRRIFSFFVIATTTLIFTACGGEDPLNDSDGSGPTSKVKTFTYAASAGEGGTISPSGSISINQGGNMTFVASAKTGKIVNEWKVNYLCQDRPKHCYV